MYILLQIWGFLICPFFFNKCFRIYFDRLLGLPTIILLFFFQMLSHLLDSLVGIAYITILLLAFSAAGNREGGDG